MKRLLTTLALALSALTLVPSSSYPSGSSVHNLHWGQHVHGRKNHWYGPRHSHSVPHLRSLLRPSYPAIGIRNGTATTRSATSTKAISTAPTSSCEKCPLRGAPPPS